MADVLIRLWSALIGLFRSRARPEAEILVLRQQINVLRRTSPEEVCFQQIRPFGACQALASRSGSIGALAIVQPETVVRWHRAGFRSFWRWKSRRRGGRPRAPLEIPRLIPGLGLAHPLLGPTPHPGQLPTLA